MYKVCLTMATLVTGTIYCSDAVLLSLLPSCESHDGCEPMAAPGRTFTVRRPHLPASRVLFVTLTDRIHITREYEC